MIANSPDRLDVERAPYRHHVAVGSGAGCPQRFTSEIAATAAVKRGRRDPAGPGYSGNGLLQSMKADLTRAEGKLADTAQRLDRNHPQYIEAAAEVKELSESRWRKMTTYPEQSNKAPTSPSSESENCNPPLTSRDRGSFKYNSRGRYECPYCGRSECATDV